jgi:hypothetical protein
LSLIRLKRQKDNSKQIKKKKQAQLSLNLPFAACANVNFFPVPSTSQSHAEQHSVGYQSQAPKGSRSAHFLPSASAASAVTGVPQPRTPQLSHSSQGREDQGM